MKDKFNTKYVSSISEYDVPMTDDLHDKTTGILESWADKYNRPGDIMTKLAKRPGQIIANMNKTIDKWSGLARGGLSGLVAGLSTDDKDDFTAMYNQAAKNKQPAFTYKGKRYPVTDEVKNIIQRLNPMKRNKPS